MNLAKPKHKKVRSYRRGATVPVWLLAVMGVAIVAAVVLMFVFARSETQHKMKAPTYQFFLIDRNEYSENAVLKENKQTAHISDGKTESATDPTPIYYAERQAFLVTKPMAWNDPSTNAEWQIPAYSELELDDAGSLWCSLTNGTRILLGGGFLSDGAGTYVFLDPVTLEVNGEAHKLPALSFCSTIAGINRLYLYGEPELTLIGTLFSNITIRADKGYSADLTAGVFTASDGGRRLLAATPKALLDITLR